MKLNPLEKSRSREWDKDASRSLVKSDSTKSNSISWQHPLPLARLPELLRRQGEGLFLQQGKHPFLQRIGRNPDRGKSIMINKILDQAARHYDHVHPHFNHPRYL